MAEKTLVTLTNMCMIYDDNNQILVLDKINDDYTGITFPGGHVENNESFTAAIIREVFEETGLHIASPSLCGIYNWITDDGSRYIIMLYKTDKYSGTIKSSDEGEVFWIKKDEFINLNLAAGMKEVFEICCNENISEDFLYKENGSLVELLL